MLFRSEHDYTLAARAVDRALRNSEFACTATPSEQEFRASLAESCEDLRQLGANDDAKRAVVPPTVA